MINRFRYLSLILLFAVSIAPAAASQSSASDVFADPEGQFTITLPAGWLGIVNTDGLGRKDVSIVFKVRENGLLKVRRADLDSDGADPMAYAQKDERERIRFTPGYDKISLEKFLLGGTKSGALLSYDYKNNSGQPFTGRVYYLRADDKTVYVLQFTGRKHILGTLRSHTDAIARSFKAKEEQSDKAEKN